MDSEEGAKRAAVLARLELSLNLSPPKEKAEKSPSLESSKKKEAPPPSDVPSSSSGGNKQGETKPMHVVFCLRCLYFLLLHPDDPSPECSNCKHTKFKDALEAVEDKMKARAAARAEAAAAAAAPAAAAEAAPK